MANVPCRTGKCGVQNHIEGSAEHQRCVQGGTSKSSTSSIIHSTPYLTASGEKYEAYHTELKDRLQRRSDAYEMYLQQYDKAETPIVRAQRWAKRKFGMLGAETSTSTQYAALQIYLSENHDRGIQDTFAGFMYQAKSQPPTDPSGHNVKSLSTVKNGVRTDFSAIHYYHEESQPPVILATETTYPAEGGQPVTEYLRVEYDIEGPDRQVIDPRTSEALGGGTYTSQSFHLAGELNEEARRLHSLIDLLTHTQDPENQAD